MVEIEDLLCKIPSIKDLVKIRSKIEGHSYGKH